MEVKIRDMLLILAVPLYIAVSMIFLTTGQSRKSFTSEGVFSFSEDVANISALRSIFQTLAAKNLSHLWHRKQVVLFMPHLYLHLCKDGKPFIDEGCQCHPERLCVFVCDSLFYNISDVVVFDAFYHHRSFPSWRPLGQKWVVHDMEAPPQSQKTWGQSIGQVKTTFNISSFFAGNSSVKFLIKAKHFIDDSKYKRLQVDQVDYVANKTKGVVWLASHCHTQSERESFVQEMTRFIDVDIFGRCGERMCTEAQNKMRLCEREMLAEYFFYLSFENSLCKDYVTEKVWKIYQFAVPIIPVVFGLANYSAFLPSGTYLDARDFPSPRQLAGYMKHLMQDTKAYNAMVTKKLATVHRSAEAYHCRLCNYVHGKIGQTETVGDIAAFWTVDRWCLDPRKVVPGHFWEDWKTRPLPSTHLHKKKNRTLKMDH